MGAMGQLPELRGRALLLTVTTLTSLGFMLIGYDNGLMGGLGVFFCLHSCQSVMSIALCATMRPSNSWNGSGNHRHADCAVSTSPSSIISQLPRLRPNLQLPQFHYDSRHRRHF